MNRAPPRPGHGNSATSDVEIDETAVALADAVQRWKHETGRAFPTFHEMVAMLERLGWTRPA